MKLTHAHTQVTVKFCRVFFWPGVLDFQHYPKEQQFLFLLQLRSDISLSVIALFMQPLSQQHTHSRGKEHSLAEREKTFTIRTFLDRNRVHEIGKVTLPKMKGLSNRIRILYSTIENMYLSLTRIILLLQQKAFLPLITFILLHQPPL